METERIPRENQIRKTSPVRTPKQKRSKDKRGRITEAAYRLFDKYGYNAVTMRMIAGEAGVSLGTPYSYFHDKRAVFKEVLVLYAEELQSTFSDEIEKAISKAKKLEEAIYSLILFLKRLMEHHRTLQKDIIILSLMDEEIRHFFSRGEMASAGGIIDLFLERFEDQLLVRDRKIAKFLIHKGIDQIIEYMMFYDVALNEKRVLRELARMYSCYLKRPDKAIQGNP